MSAVMLGSTHKHRFRFSLRTLLIVVVLLSVALGWFALKMREAERQRQAVEAISEAHGWFYYDYELDESGRLMQGQERPAPAWLRKLVGDDFFADVVRVSLPYRRRVDDVFLKRLMALTGLRSLRLSGTQVTDEGLKHLEGLTKLEHLELDGTEVTDEGIEELRKALPNCDIRREPTGW